MMHRKGIKTFNTETIQNEVKKQDDVDQSYDA